MNKTDKKDGFYIITFRSANHCIQTEKKAGKQSGITVIPTPVELTTGCGLSLRFPVDDFSAVKVFYDTLTVPAEVYFIHNKKIDGKRMTEKLL